MPADPENAPAKPDKKPNQLQDLSTKTENPDAADKIKGGVLVPAIVRGKIGRAERRLRALMLFGVFHVRPSRRSTSGR